ncbi:MAG: peptidylprolyl isomerase [Candidatus Dependentiae bacterium]|nr:peptidylprolyl isomerase [Candidatus Dependentiae bacterium]
MITYIRSYLQSGVHKVVLLVFVLMYALGSALPGILRQTTANGAWAFRINNQEISHVALVREVEKQQNYIAQVRAQYGEYADMFLKNIDVAQLAISTVQQEELINQVADAVGIRFNHDFIAEKLHDQRFVFGDLMGLVPPSVLSDSGIDQKALHKHLSRKGLSMRDFERKVERVLGQHMVGDLVASAAYVPAFELKSLYGARYLDKKFSYLKLALEPYLQAEKQIDIPKADLVSFYTEHQADYTIPEKRSGSVWIIDADTFGVQITDEKIEDYYTKNKTSGEYQDKPSRVQVRRLLFAVKDDASRAAIKQQAEQVRTELMLDPSTFATKARTLSADAESKDKGGMLPFFAKGEKDPLFERTAFLLKVPGDISEVIETSKGFELIQLVEKQMRTIKPLSVVKEDIRKKLINRAFKSTFESEMRTLLAQKEQGAQIVEEFALTKQAKNHIVTNVTANNSREAKALFGIKKAHGITFYSEDNKGVIVYLADIQKQHVPAIADIEHVVKEDVYKSKAKKAVEQDLYHAQKLSATQSFEQLHKTFGGVTASSDWINVQDSESLKRFLPKNTPYDFLVQMEKVGSTMVKVTTDGGILIKVDALADFDAEAFALKQNSLNKELERKKEQLATQGFVASLYRNATIETNDNISVTQK